MAKLKPKAQPKFVPPSTGYPPKKPCKCPAEILSKAAGGGKRAS